MANFIQADSTLYPDGMQPILFLDPAKGAPVTTIPAALVDQDSPAQAANKRTSLFGKTAEAPKADPKSAIVPPSRKNVFEELFKMMMALKELEALIIKWTSEDQLNLSNIGDSSYKASHEQCLKQIDSILKSIEQDHQNKTASVWQKWAARIVGVCAILLSGGFGVGFVMAAMFALQEFGVMDKLNALPTWAKVLVIVAVAFLAGCAASLAQYGFKSFVAKEMTEATKLAIVNSAKASGQMAATTAGTQMLGTLNPIQDILMSIIPDKKLAMALSVLITLVITMITMYYAGSAAAGQLGDSPKLVLMTKVAGLFMTLGSLIQFATGIALAVNYKDMADTEKNRAEFETILLLMKSVFHLSQAQFEQTATYCNEQLKRFEESVKHAASFVHTGEVLAEALAGRA